MTLTVKRKDPSHTKNTLCAILTALLAGCGGGEGSGESSQGASQFSPTVSPAGTRAVSLQWDTPDVTQDGSCSIDLLGYRVNFGLSPGSYTDYRPVSVVELECSPNGEQTACGPGKTCYYQLRGLQSASWYITVQAFDTYGNTSRHSNEIVRTLN